VTKGPDKRPFNASRRGARDIDQVPKDRVADAIRPEQESPLHHVDPPWSKSETELQPVEGGEKDKRTPWQRNFDQIFDRLVTLYAGNPVNVRDFLNSPNPHLENQSPNELFGRGDFRPVELLVRAMENREMT
jgi:hypothetical protein